MGIAKAVITGASRGIGRELAMLLASRGVELFLVARDQKLLQELARDIGANILQADLATQEGQEKILLLIEQETPDLVVNNAGIGFYGSFAKQESLSETIELNCHALALITQHAARVLIDKGKQGTILNISSVLSCFATPYAALYSASKSFVSALSKAFDSEVKGQGVRVLCACPGQVATQFCVHASQGVMEQPSLEDASCMQLAPKAVAQALFEQIEKQKPYTYIDWKYQLVAALGRFVPERISLAVLSKMYKKRSGL